jgi:hypothetical protein
MGAKITVEKTEHSEFRVRISEGESESVHFVTLNPKDYMRLTEGQMEPEVLVRRSFEFLLEREPKESILRRFDLPMISHYFPEYEREIKNRQT